MKWNNEVQQGVVEEWVEGIQRAKGRQALRVLRKQIAERYGLNTYIIQAIIEGKATEGLSRVEANKTDGHSWEPINYHELIGDLKERVEAVERKLGYLMDGVEKVLTDGETMAIHLGNLRQMGKWVKGRQAIDMEEMTRAPLDENERPRLPDIESQNTIADEAPKGERKRKRGEIKIKARATYNELDPMEKIERLRTQADNARKRGELLFRGIEEGKAGDPR